MLSLRLVFQSLLMIAAASALTACKNGGDVTVEPGAAKVVSQGSPYVQVNQGGQALLVQQGQTATTGVHGWVTVQAVTSTQMKSSNASGISAVMNHQQVAQ